MDKVYEELDEAKAEIEKLRAECRTKLELSERLKRAHNEQLVKIQESGEKIEKQAQELSEKAYEISVTKQMYEVLESNLKAKEAIIKNLRSANDKLRLESDEKLRKLEEEKRELVLALDEANEKNMDQGHRICEFKEEIEGLKGIVSVSQKKCLEAEKKARGSKELKRRDDILFNLEEENKKVDDQLKWKKEQFKHLEEAHEKLKDQFRESKKEWENEKSTLVYEISTLETNLDFQTRISNDLKSRLQMCNQALAHEESRRKCLEVQISETKQSFENVSAECKEAKSRIECLTGQREKEIATLRDRLGTKETIYKEMEYRVGKLEEENRDLLSSLKELQEAQIKEVGSSSSMSKLRNKLKIVRSRESEWSSQLESKDRVIKELKTELQCRDSLITQLELQNEELNLTQFVLKSEISEAPLKLGKEREENEALRMKQLETKNADLEKAQTEIKEEREKVESLKHMEIEIIQLKKELDRDNEMIKEGTSQRKRELKEAHDALDRANVELGEKFCERNELEFELQIWKSTAERLKGEMEDLEKAQAEIKEERENVENHKTRLQKELERDKEVIKEENLWMKMELKEVRDALDRANNELGEKFCERNELELELQIWKSTAERLKAEIQDLEKAQTEIKAEREDMESQKIQLQKELGRDREMIKEETLQMKRELREARDALDRGNNDLGEIICERSELEFELEIWKSTAERLKAEIEDLEKAQKEIKADSEDVENQKIQLQKELERDKDMIKEETLRMKMELREAHDALDRANDELGETFCDRNDLEFELQIWKSIAERLKVELEENQKIRRELENSLLQQVEVEVTLKEEKERLEIVLEEKERRVDDLEEKFNTTEGKFLGGGGEAKENFSEDLHKEINEKNNLHRLLEERDRKIDDLEQLVCSLEQKIKLSVTSFSSQLEDALAEVRLLREAWEKIRTAEFLKEMEIEEKSLMIIELEDDLVDLQKKMELQEKILYTAKEKREEIEAQVETKEMEIRELTCQLETELITSENEKCNLLADLKRLVSDRDSLLDILGGISAKISELSGEDMQLMGKWRSIVQNLDNNSMEIYLKGGDELFDPLKENMNINFSPTMKKVDAVLAERSPLRSLNS